MDSIVRRTMSKVNAKENRGAAMACCSQTIEEMSGCNLHLKLSVRSRGYTWDGNYSSLIGSEVVNEEQHTKTNMATSKEIKEEYTSSLADLTFNSKPLISVLTMLAEENAQHARDIVEAIEEHLAKVRTDVKLPVLYLIDCIIKNVGGPYLELFCQNIVPTFCSVFQSVDERTRAEMFKLRQTWNEYLPPQKLYAMDVQIKMLDPAWPVSAKPPSSLIHVNPKFLNSTTNTAVSRKKNTAANKTSKTTPPVSTAASLDPQTLDMQQKLINKQKQLIELQQKKLELELLQAQVKLQEQLKSNTTVTQANLLLKPEVAKQLVNTTASNKLAPVTSVTSSVGGKLKPSTTPSSSVIMNQRLQNVNSVGSNGGPKIAPPNSALIAASRSIRDPRLRRLQQNQNSVVNSNVQLESKPVDSANKIVNSKSTVRDTRTDPRTLVNKDDSSAPSDKMKSVSRPFLKSRSKLHDESVRKSLKPPKTDSSDSKESSSKSSSSSAESLVKAKRDKKLHSPVKSTLKIKKKPSPAKPEKTDVCPTFKDIKQSMKNRNYIRRNRKQSESPETTSRDTDLRLGAPPEKQTRLQEDKCVPKTSVAASQGMDVDLRQLPAVIGKKRPSTEAAESSATKKNKTEMFDVLFGNEDTDLRQLSAVIPPPPSPPMVTERPPTPPPPPIISSKPAYKENHSHEPPKKPNLDILRAKLSNATLKDKLSGSAVDTKKVDIDLRSFMAPQISPEKSSKIVISPDDEQCIKKGNMTKDQEKALMSKILAQIETQKVKDTQQESPANISLQPISDEEIEGEFSEEEEEEEKKAPKVPEVSPAVHGDVPTAHSDVPAAHGDLPQADTSAAHGDKDERVPPLHSSGQTGDYQKQSYYGGRRQHSGWRGRRGKHYEGPHARGGGRQGARPEGPWIRNVNGGPWRPMGPTSGFNRAPAPDRYIPPHREQNDFVQEQPMPLDLDPAPSFLKGRPNPWMVNSGPWQQPTGTSAFNRGSPGQGEILQERVGSPDRNSNSPQMFQQQNLNNLDVLSHFISSAVMPQLQNPPETIANPANPPSSDLLPPIAPQPVQTAPLNINELLQKLVETGIVTTTASEQPPATVLPPELPAKTVPKKSLTSIRPVTFSRPETLKVLQPVVFQLLYTGMQCSSCGMRFPPEQSMLYSQHLDWHFRQNRKGKKNIRKAASRRWYYTLSDWKNYEEIEDLEEREKSYFDQQQAQTEGGNEDVEEEIEIPTVPADPNVQDARCEICQDRFEQFYNEEKEEWQLRMAMRANDKTYHPLCYEDYQASLSIPIDVSANEDVPSPNEEDSRIPGLEIVVDDDEEEDKESKAEAVESEEKVTEEEQPPVEEDDDVILNEVAPERIVVDDDDDNEEEMEYDPSVKVKIEPVDDGFIDVEGGVLKVKSDGEIKIKAEPKDSDESLADLDDTPKTDVDTTRAEMVSSIDGNVELDSGTTTTSIGGKIRINISKPLPAVTPREPREAPVAAELSTETFIDPSQPLPPGEEPIQLNLKPALQGVELRRLPPVEAGRELTGLCSIM